MNVEDGMGSTVLQAIFAKVYFLVEDNGMIGRVGVRRGADIIVKSAQHQRGGFDAATDNRPALGGTRPR